MFELNCALSEDEDLLCFALEGPEDDDDDDDDEDDDDGDGEDFEEDSL